MMLIANGFIGVYPTYRGKVIEFPGLEDVRHHVSNLPEAEAKPYDAPSDLCAGAGHLLLGGIPEPKQPVHLAPLRSLLRECGCRL